MTKPWVKGLYLLRYSVQIQSPYTLLHCLSHCMSGIHVRSLICAQHVRILGMLDSFKPCPDVVMVMIMILHVSLVKIGLVKPTYLRGHRTCLLPVPTLFILCAPTLIFYSKLWLGFSYRHMTHKLHNNMDDDIHSHTHLSSLSGPLSSTSMP